MGHDGGEADATAREYLEALCRKYGAGDVGAGDVEALLALVKPKRAEAGEVVAREGDPAEGAFLVVAGRLRASVRVAQQERVVNEALEGEIIGEAGIFMTGARRSATLTAAAPTTYLLLGRDLFRASATNRAVIATEQHLLHTLVRRIAHTDALVTRAWRESAPGGRSALDGLSLLLGGGA
ncbi:MAG TPA: cyclic nucleotide-binding domain-containing protein [Polyangia bacterium]|nr:cyclic nucleotide-binding domain-containing protein [Polyangia bacterium]